MTREDYTKEEIEEMLIQWMEDFRDDLFNVEEYRRRLRRIFSTPQEVEDEIRRACR